MQLCSFCKLALRDSIYQIMAPLRKQKKAFLIIDVCVCVLVHRLHTALNERKRTETKTFTNTTGITVNSTENNTQTPCTTQ